MKASQPAVKPTTPCCVTLITVTNLEQTAPSLYFRSKTFNLFFPFNWDNVKIIKKKKNRTCTSLELNLSVWNHYRSKFDVKTLMTATDPDFQRRVIKSSSLYQFNMSPFNIEGRNISVGKATRYGIRIQVEARFPPPVQTCPGAHPAYYTIGTGSSQGVERSECGI